MTRDVQKGAYEKCGAKKRGGPGLCTRPAGWGTDHAGVGKCKLHGGASPIKHGRYSKIPRERLRHRLDELAASDSNPLDLVPDLQLLRAVLLEVNSLPITEMGPKFAELHADLIEKISRVAKRIHEMREEKSVSLEQLRWIKTQMGMVVAEHVKDADTLRAIESGWGAIVVRS
jgi:hypothetical protein